MGLRTSRKLCAVLMLVVAGSLVLPATAAVEGRFHRILNVNGAVNIDVTTGSGNIRVRTGAADSVEITGRIRASGWLASADRVHQLEANPPIQQSGNTIRIGHTPSTDFLRNISIDYELVVPAQTQVTSHSGSGNQSVDGIRGSLDVTAGSGNVNVANVGSAVIAETGSGDMQLEHVDGNVQAKTGSGSITALAIGGGFSGETGSGRIELEQAAPGSVHVKAGSGTIELRGVRGTLEARAGSGEISAEGDPTGGWTVHTGSGSVRLRLANDAAFDLDARTGSGVISLNRPVTVQGRITRKEIHGKVRGGGPAVEVHTSSGNIEIL
ncbi:MAG TPA: DUF4097 family beta strand repeat-containing protein [Terriglobales bacterium]|nr:DUF4097 family beta strand repeat-containing protein [Terriglobales bacterium]